jgi:GAF domain-containing protein
MQGERVVAVLGFERGEREWGARDTALVQGIAEQLGLAVETQRLLDATQLRAAREQLTLRIAEQVRSALDVEEILQVASLSLGQELGATDVVVRLGTERTLLGPSGPNTPVVRP